MSDVKITINENGPLKVEGDVPLFDHEGNRVEPPRADRYSLCRCGGSTNKPFCDGTHSRIGFVGAEAAVRAADEQAAAHAGPADGGGASEASSAAVVAPGGSSSSGESGSGQSSGRRRDEYIERLKEKLDEWNTQIDRVEARVAEAQADAKVRYREMLDELKGKRAEAETRLRELQGASDSAWEELKEGAETAWVSLREAVRKARQEFDRPE